MNVSIYATEDYANVVGPGWAIFIYGTQNAAAAGPSLFFGTYLQLCYILVLQFGSTGNCCGAHPISLPVIKCGS